MKTKTKKTEKLERTAFNALNFDQLSKVKGGNNNSGCGAQGGGTHPDKP